MKRTLLSTLVLVLLMSTNGFSQLFPSVNNPKSADMSILAMQFSIDEDGVLGKSTNLNFTGWAPAVTGPNGEIVPFRVFNTGADINTIFYAENLEAGEYTLTGFYHVYTDYDKLDEYTAETGDKSLVSYEPYANRPYHIKQLMALSEPVVVNLQPNSMMAFGNFAAQFQHHEGLAGTSPDRWRAKDSSKITVEEPHDEYILRYMKSWATPKWKRWNAKNSATPLESGKKK